MNNENDGWGEVDTTAKPQEEQQIEFELEEEEQKVEVVQVEEPEEEVKEEPQDEIIFNSDEGKIVLADLEKRCHYHSTTNIKGDSHESAYMEGQRSVLLFIKSMLRKDKEK